MKKKYAVVLFLVIVGSFWVGSCNNQQQAVEANPPAGESTSLPPGAETGDETWSMSPGTVEITPERQQLIGVRVGVVEKKPWVHTLRILGRVEADETKIYRINASVDGWIEKAYDNSVGSLVKKGEVLATFSNPQFLDAEQGYLFAVGTVERLGLGKRRELGRKEAPTQAAYDPYVLQRQIDLLRGMGVEDSQIEEISRTRKITLDIRITAPVSGFITARKVSPKERFLKGAELYRIVNLDRVWILADVFEHEVRYFKAGAMAVVRLPQQERTYHAAVSKVLPIFDPDTLTFKVRLETDNPAYLLRPDMFVDVEFPVSLPPAVTVPADAVLHSGLRKTVFVDQGNGIFEARQVKTGWRMGNRIEIVHGLEPGEKVVISGNFFIDSESRIQAAAQGIYGAVRIDPVCGMEVDEEKAKVTGLTSDHMGKTYYFCMAACKAEFDKGPEQFVEKPSETHDSPHTKNHPGAGHD